ncbi:MAG: conjugal transfer protein TraF [Elusimicrobiota bacterium]
MNKTLSAVLAFLIAAAPAGAVEWNTMGPRSMGMGGAGVALAQGPLASYWNPAALGRATENSYGFSMPVSVHAALTGTAIAGAKDLQNAQSNCTSLGAAACQAQINVALGELANPTNGLRVDGSAGGDFKVGKIAFFANGFLDAGAVPRIDQTHNGTNPGAPATYIGNNTSALIVKGARILEFGAGYGHELPFAPGVFLGGDLKLMRAQVGYANYLIIQNNNNSSNIISNLKTGAVDSSNIGIDAGALWDVERTFQNARWQPRVGLTGRNLNNPKFSQPASAAADGVGGKYAVNPQARLGLAISPLHWWNIAADMDLTRNLTPVDGVASRQLGLGTEVNVFNRTWINIPLRFGLARNLETGTNMLTAGAGLNFLHLMVDFAGEASGKRIDTQTQGKSSKVPQEFGASVSLSLLFGGSEDRPSKTDIQMAPTTVPAAPAAAPAATDAKTLTPAEADQVKKNADKAQQDMSKEPTKP